jgi:hypothetical protein
MRLMLFAVILQIYIQFCVANEALLDRSEALLGRSEALLGRSEALLSLSACI